MAQKHLLERRSSFQNEVDRLFENFLQGFGGRESSFSPACEIDERGGQFVLSCDLPGLSKDDVKIEIHRDILTVSGERKSSHEEKDEKRGFFRTERSYGSFSRSIRLPEGVEPEQIKASFENGVLEVAFPNAMIEHKPKHIRISEGKQEKKVA